MRETRESSPWAPTGGGSRFRRLTLLGLAALVVTTAWLGAIACQTGPEVARVKNGRDVSGRWIDPEAYAAYLDGVIAETHGNDAAAAAAYERAIAADPAAAEAWARLGAVRCLPTRTEADRAFNVALSLSPQIEEGWLAAAECDLRRGDGMKAVKNAERALTLGPNDPEASRVLSRALELAGDSERARVVLHALALRRGSTSEEKETRGELAVRRALDLGDVTTARSAGRSAGMPDADVALLALALGRPRLAASVAELALLSDPGDANARIAALTSADLGHEDEALARYARSLPSDGTRIRPSAAAAVLMEELLARRVSREAARAWAQAMGIPPLPDPAARAPSPLPCTGDGCQRRAVER